MTSLEGATNIFELFGDPALGETGSGAAISGAGLQSAIDQVYAQRPAPTAPEGPPPASAADPGIPGVASPGLEGGGGIPGMPAAGGGTPGQPQGFVGAPAPAPPQAPGTPFGGYPYQPGGPMPAPVPALPDPGLELARQALEDPERRDTVLRAIVGAPVAAPVVPAPAPAAPAMPEGIEPGSPEALLWQANQDNLAQNAALREQIEQIRADVQAGNSMTAAEQGQRAVDGAVKTFTSRYPSLAPADVWAIRQEAARLGLPDALLPTVNNNPEAAVFASMDYVLRSSDTYLQKALSAPAPVIHPGDTPEAIEHKRKLTALSSAASPTGDAPQRAPIQMREDGLKMTEGSRLALVQQMAEGMRREREGF
jgi:hypothetical protein